MRYHNRPVLRDVTLEFAAGEMVAVVGPNGAGKSTLLGIMAGLRHHFDGECLYKGRSLRNWNRRQFAREVSMVPQMQPVEFAFSAHQVVMMGRVPFGNGMFESPADYQAVHDAMELTDTLQFSDRDLRTLSGGERQRVILAAALAQTPKALLLDEPTTFLDLQHQLGMYRLLQQLCQDGLLAVAITHDLNLAAAFSTRIVLLHQGRILADGPPSQVFRRDLLEEVFCAHVHIETAASGRLFLRYAD